MGVAGQALEDIAWAQAFQRPEPRSPALFVHVGPSQLCKTCGLKSPIVSVASECSSCWLHSTCNWDAGFANLALLKGGMAFVQELLLQRTAPFGPQKAEFSTTFDESGADQRDQLGKTSPRCDSSGLAVIWDALDPGCAWRTQALRIEFPDLCVFVELHDEASLHQLLSETGLSSIRHRICRAGALSAVLASGVFIANCEEHPKVLVFELLYRRTLRLPSWRALERLHSRYFRPLAQLRGHEAVAATGPQLCQPYEPCEGWWQKQAALQLIAESLEKECFAIVDGFLPAKELQTLQEVASMLFKEKHMRAGIEEQSGGYGGYWGDGNEGDFQNKEGLDRKWTMEGDFRAWVPDDDVRASRSLQLLTRASDSLIRALKDEGKGQLGLSASVTQRIRRIHFREHTMVSCYPGATRARYLRHCDTGRQAALTAILYLNKVKGFQTSFQGLRPSPRNGARAMVASFGFTKKAFITPRSDWMCCPLPTGCCSSGLQRNALTKCCRLLGTAWP
ncbi:unnamed protein product [Polarella glacialis]|uniref:Uncharacterized protein n=1 Tax=Polarella glacialis TaxID=89957 RepID=A0A813DCG0_POLGL|nr:unnamed protein product [Polarella glacialis]